MLSAIMVVLALPIQAQAATARTITIFRIDGTNAELFRNGASRSTAPRNNFRVNPGNTITTGANTQIYLNFDTSSLIKMDSHSEVNFELTSNLLGINLHSGNALVQIDQQPANTSVEARLGAVAFTVRGTMFTVGYADDEGIGQVALLSGSGEIGDILIEAGQVVTIDTDSDVAEPILVSEIDFEDLDAFTILEIVNNREYLEENSEFFADAEIWDEVAIWVDAALEEAAANGSLPASLANGQATPTAPAPAPRRSFSEAQARRQVAEQARRAYEAQNNQNQADQGAPDTNVFVPQPMPITPPQPAPTAPPVVVIPPTQPPTTTPPPYEITAQPPITVPPDFHSGGFTGITPTANRTGSIWEAAGPAINVQDTGNNGTIVAREQLTQLMPHFNPATGGNLRHIMVSADYFVGAPANQLSGSLLVNLQNTRGFALATPNAYRLAWVEVENALPGFWDWLAGNQGNNNENNTEEDFEPDWDWDWVTPELPAMDNIGDEDFFPVWGRFGNIFTETTTPSAIGFDLPISRNFESIAPFQDTINFSALEPLRTQINTALNAGNVLTFGAIGLNAQGEVVTSEFVSSWITDLTPVDWFITALVSTGNGHNQAILHMWRTPNFPLTPPGGVGSHFIGLPIEYITHPSTNTQGVSLFITHHGGWAQAGQTMMWTQLAFPSDIDILPITRNGGPVTFTPGTTAIVGGTGRTDGIRIREGFQGVFNQTDWLVEIEITTPGFYWANETLNVLNMQNQRPIPLWQGATPITTRYTMDSGLHLGPDATSNITTITWTDVADIGNENTVSLGINGNTLSFIVQIPNVANVNRLVNDEINIRGLQIAANNTATSGAVNAEVRFRRAGGGAVQTVWMWQPGEQADWNFNIGAAWAALPTPAENFNVIVSLENGVMVWREVAAGTPLTGNDVMAFHSVTLTWGGWTAGMLLGTQQVVLANFTTQIAHAATTNQLEEDEETDKKESEPPITIIHEESPIEPDPDDFLEDTYDLWRNGRFSDMA